MGWHGGVLTQRFWVWFEAQVFVWSCCGACSLLHASIFSGFVDFLKIYKSG